MRPRIYTGYLQGSPTPSVGDVVPSSSNYAVDAVRSYRSSTRGGLTHHVTPRLASFTADRSIARTSSEDNPGYSDLQSDDGGGHFTYSVNRDVSACASDTATGRVNTRTRLRTTEHDHRHRRRLQPADLAQRGGPPCVQRRVPGSSKARSEHPRRICPRRRTASRRNMAVHGKWAGPGQRAGAYHRGLVFIDGLQGPAYTDGGSATVADSLNASKRFVVVALGGAKGELASLERPLCSRRILVNVRLQMALGDNWWRPTSNISTTTTTSGSRFSCPWRHARADAQHRSWRAVAAAPPEDQIAVLPGKKYAPEDIVRILIRRAWLMLLPLDRRVQRQRSPCRSFFRTGIGPKR